MGFFTSYSAAHRPRICNMVYYFTDAGERGTTAGAVIWHCIQIRPTQCGCGTISIYSLTAAHHPLVEGGTMIDYRQRNKKYLVFGTPAIHACLRQPARFSDVTESALKLTNFDRRNKNIIKQSKFGIPLP